MELQTLKTSNKPKTGFQFLTILKQASQLHPQGCIFFCPKQQSCLCTCSVAFATTLHPIGVFFFDPVVGVLQYLFFQTCLFAVSNVLFYTATTTIACSPVPLPLQQPCIPLGCFFYHVVGSFEDKDTIYKANF